MTEAKHTPGIWFVNYESKDVGDDKLSVEVDGDYFIAQVDEGICQEANARLIAAAPELLDALRSIKKRMYEPRPFSIRACEAIIDDAIAKATGK